jgi:LysR family transcriptional regulator, glycine cleavage system transcriptional activator
MLKKRAQLPLTALRAFEVTARQRSLKQACVELHLTPGAVSQQVRALEDRMGVQLFDRTSGRYELTPIGHRLMSRLTHCFDDMEVAVNEVFAHAEPKRLRLKLAPTFAMRWLAPRMITFYAHNPGIDLEVTTISTDADITSEECDFVVQFGRPPWSDFDEIFLFQDDLVAVCDPKVARSLKKPHDLQRQTFLHSSLRPDDWAQWLNSMDLDTAMARKGPKFPNSALACEAAISGAGVAVLQKAYVQTDLDQGRLVALFDHHAMSDRGYYMTSSRHRRNEKKIKDFSKWLRKVV